MIDRCERGHRDGESAAFAGSEREGSGNGATDAPDIVEDDGGGGVDVADGEEVAVMIGARGDQRFAGDGEAGGKRDLELDARRQRGEDNASEEEERAGS